MRHFEAVTKFILFEFKSRETTKNYNLLKEKQIKLLLKETKT